MTIQDADSSDSIFLKVAHVLLRFYLFDGDSSCVNSGFMINNSSWDTYFLMGDIDFRGIISKTLLVFQ